MRKYIPILKRKKLEKTKERDNRSWAERAGWFVTKIMQTSTGGFPDRFYARCEAADRCPHCGRGRVVLMEWKRDGEPPSALQLERVRQLIMAGVEVYVVDDEKMAKRILERGRV